MMQLQHDVVIAGAGMVGATLATALGGSSLRVAVIETAPPVLAWEAESIDLRASAISRASENIFRHLGAWEDMVARRVSPYREMHVWDEQGEIHFDCADLGEASMGHIIENRVVCAALLEAMQRHSNVELLCPTAVVAVKNRGAALEVELSDGRRLITALLVGADGIRSKVRELAGVECRGWSYEQKGVVAVVTTTLPHHQTAWQHFLPAGPLAFLPLNDGRCSIVWSTTPTHADQLVALDEAEFCRQLTEAFAAKLGEVTAVSKRAAFPLRLQHADHYCQERIALIGDAAHVIHPLAGQGANLGFLDAATLAEVVLQAATAGKDIGKLAVLRRYERWRRGDNTTMMFAMDGFKRLFSNDIIPLKWARGLALNSVNRSPLLKHEFMRRAMGLKGDLPPLA
ncbi:MAG: UbiH/UbiF/VisC/COQ6 family ubiquinone biosynthesis hydroxylase, partial [Halothiobacillaceae bacterium]